MTQRRCHRPRERCGTTSLLAGTPGRAASSTASSGFGGPNSDESEKREDVRLERRDPLDSRAIGEVGAPVALSYWTHLRCPFCAVFSRDTPSSVSGEYVDAGLIRIDFNDVAHFGDRSCEQPLPRERRAIRASIWIVSRPLMALLGDRSS
ncbi:thioredoxin domain-containing protein [Microbacterium sp. NPDC089695]|uniref:thioredoxin domain-containing protein n=1 Tax=Microbacterium sp. NPDC089695 TaxID=3364198 RepID=UPI0038155933